MPNKPHTQLSVVRQIDAVEAERLIRIEPVQILDVRTPKEFTTLGHIPDAKLTPLDFIASAPAVLDFDKPVLVYCEHGIRSKVAAEFLLQAGFNNVLNMVGGMSCWRHDRSYKPQMITGPAPWLLDYVEINCNGRALDVASGRGRHALLLAALGWHVRAVDRDERAINELQTIANRLALNLVTNVVDLELGQVDLGRECYDLIVVTRYLHRPLFEMLIDAVSLGGVLFYETFMSGQERFGKPTNPDFLLMPGELRTLVAPLEIIKQREGLFDGQIISSVIAQKTIR